jgi:hypothetical protein
MGTIGTLDFNIAVAEAWGNSARRNRSRSATLIFAVAMFLALPALA